MLKNHSEKIEIEESSGNVFFDLGMPDAEEKLAKVELSFKINEIFKKKKLTQTEAAKLLGVDQGKISLLNKGRLSSFSIERLIRYLNILHQDIQIVIKPNRSKRAEGCLSVVYA